MFAILETGGKQYKVSEGDVIEVERIKKNKISDQNTVNFQDVLLIQDKDLHLGQPLVENGVIEAKILEEFKAPKIIVFKKKSKKGYKRTRGHRQILHRIQIEKIAIRKVTKTQAEKAPPASEKAKAPAKSAAKKTAAKGKAAAVKPKTATAKKKPAAAKTSSAKPVKKATAAPKTKSAAAKTSTAKPVKKTTTASKAAKKTTTAKKEK